MEKLRRNYDFAPAGPAFSRAVRVGNTLHVAGTTARGTDAQGKPVLEQLKAVLDRIVRVVEAEGGKAEDIVKVCTFVTDMGDWWPTSEEQTAVWKQFFNGHLPANTMVGISALAEPGLDVEVDAIAELD